MLASNWGLDFCGPLCLALSTTLCLLIRAAVQAVKGKTKAMQTQRHDGSETTVKPTSPPDPTAQLTGKLLGAHYHKA